MEITETIFHRCPEGTWKYEITMANGRKFIYCTSHFTEISERVPGYSHLFRIGILVIKDVRGVDESSVCAKCKKLGKT